MFFKLQRPSDATANNFFTSMEVKEKHKTDLDIKSCQSWILWYQFLTHKLPNQQVKQRKNLPSDRAFHNKPYNKV